ncbi:unnamed protein product [Clavelina lepadiformis]|uniref:Fibrinogen C-terminal domain-containing protein n=1 Tax=Clavelina lepadiformis TaxID=159417 RepID=A0ABP0F4K1_CLALP
MNRLLVLTLLLVGFGSVFVKAQQCRYVPVCDDQIVNMGNPTGVFKGEKGDAGVPGRAGAKGQSSVGVKGDKGQRGDKCEDGALVQMQRQLHQMQSLLIPASCLTSSVYGKQRLRSGEEVFCDSGWRVIQRRFDGSVAFNLNWADYKVGFGNLTGEFWLGLDKIHQLTKNRGCRLRIDLWKFDDDHRYAEYSTFQVEDESDLYRLHVHGYSGTAGDSLSFHNNRQFSTKDRDNDLAADQCALRHSPEGAAWWFKDCFRSTLNAPWGRSNGAWTRIIWHAWASHDTPMKATTMKVRCD